MLGMAGEMASLGDAAGGERLMCEAIARFRTLQTPFSLNYGRAVLADLLRKQDRHAEAISQLDEAVAVYERYRNPVGLWYTLNARSRSAQALGRLADARADAERAYALADEIGFLAYRSESAQRMAALAEAAGEQRQAEKFHAESVELAEKAVRENAGVNLPEFVQRYEFASKDRLLEQLSLRNERMWLVLGGIALLLGLTTFFLLSLRRSNRLLEASNAQLRQSQDKIEAFNASLEQSIQASSGELRQQTHYLRTLFDTLPVSVWLKDVESRYLAINAPVNDLGPEEVIGRTDLELWPGEVGQFMRSGDIEVMQTRRRVTREVSIRESDGSVSWREIDKAPVIDEDGSVLGTVGVSRDISERKQLEVVLQDAHNFLYNIIDNIVEPIYVKDRQHRWIHVNEAFCRFIGRSRIELIGKSDYDFFPEHEADEFWAGDEAVFTEGLEFASEEEFTNSQGETRHIYTRKTAFIDGNGESILVGIISDFTERRRMEEALASREREFRTLAENAPDNIVRYDLEGRIVYVNAGLENTLGMSAADLVGKLDRDIHPDGSFNAYSQTLNRVLATGDDGEVEVELPAGDRDKQHHHVRMVAERNERGELTGVLAIGRDISGIRRYEAARDAALEEALRLAKLRSEFLAHMSHELRTPLNGILGYAQLLQRDKAMDGRYADALNVIRQSGEHLLALVEDILDLARIEAGKFELAMSNIPLLRFLSVVAEIVGVRAREKRFEFICDLADDLPEGVRGDEKRLRQVLLNLLVNAVKFTDSGRVTLRVSRVTPSRLAFAVEDTGSGIEASELETIFLPFEQSGDARQRFGGSGLGLSISRQLVRLMGGDIVVESRVGVGSVFRFELELPEVDIAPFPSLPETVAVDRVYPCGDEADVAQMLPPEEEIRTLHRLAQQGNMRDILQYAERIAMLDPGYGPFAERLRQMAEGYQSKAILALAEQLLSD
ncbi:MAG TPA: PAS domain-containing protein [Gallionella sp.]|nr:PAS domain-containing protein [Gallionella sp.]